MSRFLKGSHGVFAWLVLGYIFAHGYRFVAGDFVTPLDWARASVVLAISLFIFVKGSEMEADGDTAILGWGMMVSVFSGLLLPAVLHQGGFAPVPDQLVWVHAYRFAFGPVLTIVLMVITFFLWIGSAVELRGYEP